MSNGLIVPPSLDYEDRILSWQNRSIALPARLRPKERLGYTVGSQCLDNPGRAAGYKECRDR